MLGRGGPLAPQVAHGGGRRAPRRDGGRGGVEPLGNRDAHASDMLWAFDVQNAPRPPMILSPRACP
jgi:hypothetical protein